MIDENIILKTIKKLTNNQLIKDVIKYDKLTLIDKISDEIVIKNIINSINSNQKLCKQWLIEKTERYIKTYENPKICVAAGWYGHLANMLSKYTKEKVISFDVDQSCETIGKMFHKDINFITSDIKDFDNSFYDIIVCTSCEHIDQKNLNNFINKKKNKSLVILQSNNYHEIKEHINCKNNLKEFVNEYLKYNVHYYNELKLDKYDRYMVVFQ